MPQPRSTLSFAPLQVFQPTSVRLDHVRSKRPPLPLPNIRNPRPTPALAARRPFSAADARANALATSSALQQKPPRPQSASVLSSSSGDAAAAKSEPPDVPKVSWVQPQRIKPPSPSETIAGLLTPAAQVLCIDLGLSGSEMVDEWPLPPPLLGSRCITTSSVEFTLGPTSMGCGHVPCLGHGCLWGGGVEVRNFPQFRNFAIFAISCNFPAIFLICPSYVPVGAPCCQW